MEQIFDAILRLDGTAVYVVVGLLAFGEAAALVGLLLPGEVAVLLGGVLAAQGRASLAAVLVVAAVAAVAGDSAGYELGRRWGSRLLATRIARRHRATVSHVTGRMQRHGGAVVFLGRWTSVLRAVVPALAGTSRMPYGRFMLFNVVGGVAWATVFTVAGYVAGESYRTIEAATGRGGWVVAAAVVGWVALRVLRRRRTNPDDTHDDACCPPAGEDTGGAGHAAEAADVVPPGRGGALVAGDAAGYDRSPRAVGLLGGPGQPPRMVRPFGAAVRT